MFTPIDACLFHHLASPPPLTWLVVCINIYIYIYILYKYIPLYPVEQRSMADTHQKVVTAPWRWSLWRSQIWPISSRHYEKSHDSNDHYSKGNCCRRKMPGPNFHGTDLGFGWVVLVCYFMSAQCEGNGWASEILHGVKTKNTGVSVEGWAGIGNLISGCLYWPF